MPDYKIKLTDSQSAVLTKIAEKQNISVQHILDKQAFYRINEQISQWVKEYLSDTSMLTEAQIVELDKLLLTTKLAFMGSINN